jgi:hypothetical protein
MAARPNDHADIERLTDAVLALRHRVNIDRPRPT